MTEDLINARTRLENGGYTCVLCRGGTVYTSDKAGIAPMMGYVKEARDLRGFAAADRVVGKAAAMLFLLAGVTQVYAPVMSDAAVQTLTAHGVAVCFDRQVPVIRNRAGTGLCPMEQAVADCEEPQAAWEALCVKIAAMQAAEPAH